MTTFSPSGGLEAGATFCCESTGWTGGAGKEVRADAWSKLLAPDEVGVTGLAGWLIE